MKIKMTVELSEKELAAALLPNGGIITNVEVGESVPQKKRVRRTKAQIEADKSTPKQSSPRKATT